MALEASMKTIRVNPDDAEAHCNLGKAANEMDCWGVAIEAFKEAIRIKPHYADAHYGMALAYAGLGCRAEAIEAFKLAVHLALPRRNTIWG